METYILENGGIKAHILNYGATLSHLWVPDRYGNLRDVVLGFDDPTEYERVGLGLNPYFGAIIGRTCNRTRAGLISVNGSSYQLPVNNGLNSLHGGIKGFDKKIWTCESSGSHWVVLSLISKVAEEGYPGEVIVTVEYALSGQGELSIDYRSEFTDSPLNNSVTETVVNLTNHSYFNLSGFTKDSVLEHHCTMSGVRGHLELDGTQIPTGKVIENSFASPCMDFTTLSTREEGRGPKTFGAGLPHVTEFRGYDHFYLVNETSEKALEPVVKVYSPESGIYVELSTDAIGFQLYTGNWLDGSLSSCKVDQPGATYGPHSGFCLEASAPPDSLNFKEWRASVILTKGKVQNRRDVYRFGTE